ncbi:alpha/beta hydrolase [Vibrio tapetis]|uniref:Esterase/lipase-like protein n=1 Tax=Vibrio tapetis subsp. tapetis TaxID=1671868 RepID=A0A2N8ZJK9_9VIBR|nr:alpha/beta hydrolase [Vibrio tapetis]SON52104.1 Esterase/lipase-like protein [Vibrio tapetis subsp. tapetis]
MKRTLLVVGIMSSFSAFAADFYVPETISNEGQTFLKENFTQAAKDASIIPSGLDDDGWKALQKSSDEQVQPLNDAAVAMYQPNIEKAVMAGIPVLDIRPKDWKDNGKVLVYIHGGAYVAYHPESTLASSVPVAADTGLRVISVDYTLAPFAQYQTITDQVIAVMEALVAQGYSMSDIAMYGDSAGGGLVAGSVLKMRDLKLDLPAAIVLWSPWADITETGDSYQTLKEAEPLYRYELLLKPSADAYAPIADQKHPYVSPVYGDYSKPFPPVLIQGGTKELLLSGMVRLYQAIDTQGGEAKLDLYEGMWHVFQAYSFHIPEAVAARKKMGHFLTAHL